MAGPDDTTTQLPHTPSRTASQPPNKLAPEGDGRPRKSPADSGVWDMFGDQTKTTPSRLHRRETDRASVVSEEEGRFWESAQTLSAQKSFTRRPPDRDDAEPEPMPEDPFDNQHNRILFDAIDRLQSFGSRGLSIPQLVIVGGQSSGKSSLLQSLTGIQFPVNSGCCTRWPTRIVSRRTKPGSEDSFRITIEPPDVTVPGMKPIAADLDGFDPIEGEILTNEEFISTIDAVSDCMGIETGTAQYCKNFASEVLKIELSGPNRSFFSILDLPGTFQNSSKVNRNDRVQVETMITEYMKKPDSIVICVLDAPTDFDRQEAWGLATEFVDQSRLIGVFTKCDMVQHEPEAAKRIVSIATNALPSEPNPLRKGWFLVRNRADKDGDDSFDLNAAERTLFATAPWNSVPPNRLGSAALKAYLGEVLNSRLRACFPDLCKGIESTLNERLSEKASLGEPRDSQGAKQQYAIHTVRQFEEMASLTLERPEYLPEAVRKLRWEVSRLNEDFDKFMRTRGARWEFEDADMDPFAEMARRLDPEAKNAVPARASSSKKGSAKLDKSFPDCAQVQDSKALMRTIEEQLAIYQAAQLPGIVNPIVYAKIYQKQVAKWDRIAQLHLSRVASAVEGCYLSILNSVCPSGENDTNKLRQELERVLKASFDSSRGAADAQCAHVCAQETRCTMLQTTAPGFGEQVLGWRQLRLFEATAAASQVGTKGYEAFVKYFDLVHPSLERNMINDVHDVLKVYYRITLEAFIRAVTHSVVEDFITSADGPIRGLTTNWVLGLDEEQLDVMCGENEATVSRRAELKSDIEKLKGALAVVDEARKQTADLERV